MSDPDPDPHTFFNHSQELLRATKSVRFSQENWLKDFFLWKFKQNTDALEPLLPNDFVFEGGQANDVSDSSVSEGADP